MTFLIKPSAFMIILGLLPAAVFSAPPEPDAPPAKIGFEYLTSTCNYDMVDYYLPSTLMHPSKSSTEIEKKANDDDVANFVYSALQFLNVDVMYDDQVPKINGRQYYKLAFSQDSINDPGYFMDMLKGTEGEPLRAWLGDAIIPLVKLVQLKQTMEKQKDVLYLFYSSKEERPPAAEFNTMPNSDTLMDNLTSLREEFIRNLVNAGKLSLRPHVSGAPCPYEPTANK